MAKNRFSILHTDVLAAFKTMPDNSYHGCLTDPPYELSDDGKASPVLVALEFMLPKDPKVEADALSECQLSSLISKVLGLCPVRLVPRPPGAMPVRPVAFDHDPSCGDADVENVSKLPTHGPDGCGREDLKAKPPEHLGSFTLECADSTALMEALDRVGTGFFAGRLGIGFRVSAASLPGLLGGCDSVNFGDPDVWDGDDPHPLGVCAGFGTEVEAMTGWLSLARSHADALPAGAALGLLAALKQGGAKLVRTGTRAGRLPAKLETRRVSIVHHGADRALTLDLLVHPQSITSRGFMGHGWDGGKAAYDVALWKEVFRVLRPGAHVLAFGGTRTFHRLTCAIEDAGFEIRDCMMWLYGSGYPKSMNVEKSGQKSLEAQLREQGVTGEIRWT